MVNFISKLFKNDQAIDPERLHLEAEGSVHRVIYDKYLLQTALQQDGLGVVEKYLGQALAIDYTKIYDLNEEMLLLQDYIASYKALFPQDFYIKFDIQKKDAQEIKIYPFILFPLVQNAIVHGYNSMEKYPIRIRIQVIGGEIKLEVSNRVNHYLTNQGENEIINYYKSRLGLLYSNDHDLIINSNSNIFKSTLILG